MEFSKISTSQKYLQCEKIKTGMLNNKEEELQKYDF